MRALVLVASLAAGCGAALSGVDDPQYLDTASKLSKCRAEGRTVASDAGVDAGWSAYEACKKDAGL